MQNRPGTRGFLSYLKRKEPKHTFLLKSSTLDPYFNLAVEDWLLSKKVSSKRGRSGWQLLYLWRDEPCVVIGKYQNPWKECKLQEMKESGVSLVRRRTGGGAVYQDEGNSNFTFISPPTSYSVDRNFSILTNALEDMGIEKGKAAKSGRNDLMVGDCKVSGSAFRPTKYGSLHHGTMLRDVDLAALSRVLTPSLAKLESKGIKSVASRVMNLSEVLPKTKISHNAFCNAVTREFLSCYADLAPKGGNPGNAGNPGDVEVEQVDHLMMSKNPDLKSSYDQLRSWNWKFGRTPEFLHSISRRFAWGTLDFHFNSNKGRISDCWIYSDCLYPALVEDVRDALQGVQIDSIHIARRLEGVKKNKDEAMKAMVEDIGHWLAETFQ